MTDAVDFALAKTSEQQRATQSFAMSNKYVPKYKMPALKANDVILINPGEICTIVALPGTGKTQLGEALGCAYIAAREQLDGIDTLGLVCYSKPDSKCLHADTERPHDDNFKSFQRMQARCNVEAHPEIIDEDGKFRVLDYQCFVDLPDTQLLKDELERLCAENSYGLILIDGALDFVASMNNEEECSSMVKWLRALAHSHGAAIVVTLHPNKGTDTMAGHLGAMLYRYSRACLAIRPHEGNSDIKLLTNQFSNGKLSHGGGEINIPFGWDEDAKMMLSLPDEAAPVSARVKVIREAAKQLFDSYAMNGRFWVLSSEVKADYSERFNKSPKTAKDHLSLAVQNGWLEKRGDTSKTEYKYTENGSN